MGTWGAGNFSDDGALDWLWSDITNPLCKSIAESGDHDESMGYIIAAKVEVLSILCEQVGAMPPTIQEVAVWRDGYLQAWDGYIDSLEPSPGYKEERREVILTTFARLMAASVRFHGQ